MTREVMRMGANVIKVVVGAVRHSRHARICVGSFPAMPLWCAGGSSQ